VRESVLCLLMNGCARTDVDRLKIRSAWVCSRFGESCIKQERKRKSQDVKIK
jgi:hypothetical protein